MLLGLGPFTQNANKLTVTFHFNSKKRCDMQNHLFFLKFIQCLLIILLNLDILYRIDKMCDSTFDGLVQVKPVSCKQYGNLCNYTKQINYNYNYGKIPQ